ncbi:hypothetical protein OSB04_026852 [Centaurea solstitialis]|uniref:Uncharacterized protein n=1 Tax=Centaurea solstitialis TaxID=347529 RepID=A0AA38SQX0_9ASTR|nr:hypothetical protein OSB04_026852 [Centaurea solstitialis]
MQENNHFSGILPPSISNCSNLIGLDVYINDFNGGIDIDFGKLLYLTTLSIGRNHFDRHLDDMKLRKRKVLKRISEIEPLAHTPTSILCAAVPSQRSRTVTGPDGNQISSANLRGCTGKFTATDSKKVFSLSAQISNTDLCLKKFRFLGHDHSVYNQRLRYGFLLQMTEMCMKICESIRVTELPATLYCTIQSPKDRHHVTGAIDISMFMRIHNIARNPGDFGDGLLLKITESKDIFLPPDVSNYMISEVSRKSDNLHIYEVNYYLLYDLHSSVKKMITSKGWKMRENQAPTRVGAILSPSLVRCANKEQSLVWFGLVNTQPLTQGLRYGLLQQMTEDESKDISLHFYIMFYNFKGDTLILVDASASNGGTKPLGIESFCALCTMVATTLRMDLWQGGLYEEEMCIINQTAVARISSANLRGCPGKFSATESRKVFVLSAQVMTILSGVEMASQNLFRPESANVCRCFGRLKDCNRKLAYSMKKMMEDKALGAFGSFQRLRLEMKMGMQENQNRNDSWFISKTEPSYSRATRARIVRSSKRAEP